MFNYKDDGRVQKLSALFIMLLPVICSIYEIGAKGMDSNHRPPVCYYSPISSPTTSSYSPFGFATPTRPLPLSRLCLIGKALTPRALSLSYPRFIMYLY